MKYGDSWSSLHWQHLGPGLISAEGGARWHHPCGTWSLARTKRPTIQLSHAMKRASAMERHRDLRNSVTAACATIWLSQAGHPFLNFKKHCNTNNHVPYRAWKNTNTHTQCSNHPSDRKRWMITFDTDSQFFRWGSKIFHAYVTPVRLFKWIPWN